MTQENAYASPGKRELKRFAESENRRLLTSEVMKLAGVSRSTTTNYINKHIIEPVKTNESSNADLMWTFEQAELIRSMRLLTQTGMSLTAISELASHGTEAICDMIYDTAIEEARAIRRTLKCNAVLNRRLESYKKCGRKTRPYLRYMPQRWLALMPTPAGTNSLPGSYLHTTRASELLYIARLLGWCPTGTVGAVSSISTQSDMTTGSINEAEHSSWWVAAQLATPPMPQLTGGLVIDGGCYRPVCPDTFDPGCPADACPHCSRFGGYPAPKDRERWNKIMLEYPEAVRRVLPVDELKCPYATGIWSEFTQEFFKSKKAKAPVRSEEYMRPGGPRQKPTWTVRPRLMPQICLLPLGTTACAMPSGFYLCMQYGEEDQTAAYQRMIAIVSQLSHYTMTEEDEVQAMERSLRLAGPRRPPRKGPFEEPFARPRTEFIPAFKDWCQEISPGELRSLKVPMGTALWPENGFCITSSPLPPLSVNDEPRLELQMLVNASALPAVAELEKIAERESEEHTRD